MVNRQTFKEKFQETNDLMGWRISDKRAKLIYDQISIYEESDVMRAMEAVRRSESFSFYEFEGLIIRFKVDREEYEQRTRQRAEQDEFMIWWHSHKGTRQECVNLSLIHI